MKAFLDADFLLDTPAAKKLYHEFAENLPILDYHCHIDPREIYEDRQFENLTQLWLGGDHYKWRLMRASGVPEAFVTGQADDALRFQKWAEALSTAIGNPLYHWSHLELQRYFGFSGHLTGENAMQVYHDCNALLQGPEYTVRGILRRSRVTLLCTTDDPADPLEWHEKLAADGTLETKVLPAWRPDRALMAEKADYLTYLQKLSAAAEMEIRSFADLKAALLLRMDFFSARGCTVSDHGMGFVPFAPAAEAEAEAIFARRLRGTLPTEAELERFSTALLLFLGREYARRGWVMQLHFGVRRNNNSARFRDLGPDTGFDSIGPQVPMEKLSAFLNALAETDELPKTVLYSLNPNDSAAIQSIMGCYQDGEIRGKVQQGSAWWFNDHLDGMRDQLRSFASIGNLSTFIGMLTDSRSFLSYTRHEYFRHILCALLGSYVEEGLYPPDWAALETIVKDICYNNAVRYFGFPLETV